MSRPAHTSRSWHLLAPAVAMTVFLVVWEYAVAAGHVRPIQLPPPTKIARSLLELATEGFPEGTRLGAHFGITVLRILAGFGLAVAIAIPLGLLIGSSRLLDKLTSPIVAFCRSVATLSLLPLAVVWFGTGEATKVFLIGYGCFWVMLSNAIAAIKQIDPVLMRAARTMDTPERDIFLKVMLPSALPRIVSGARVALGVGFMVIVGAEMIGTTRGLGALIMEARTFYRSDITMVGMFVIGGLGLALSAGLTLLEGWLLPWQAAQQETGR
jgi:ABC-type nitrate/sulfonate/bicarbonate transport system permease component